jgi:archaellum biogenesis protein FlaJ (TadC family)
MYRKKRGHGMNPGEKPKISAALVVTSIFISLIVGVLVFFTTTGWLSSVISIVAVFVLIQAYLYTKKKLDETTKIKKMEDVFPDFLQLMSSNLRAGMTIDRALLLSSRKEFAPLDKEILNLGKDIITGKEIEVALQNMSKKIGSEKINKTINLVISGIRSGGNLAILLEETAANMRERNFVEKRAASNVLMYVIFIFFAIAVGAPALFGLSTVLVETLTAILSTIPEIDSSAASSMPFTLTEISVSPVFIMYFSIIFIIALDILGSMVVGLVSKGDEKSGMRYVVILLMISLGVYFSVKIILSAYLSSFV